MKVDLPEQPSKRTELPHNANLRILANSASRYPGRVSIENGDIGINCDDLQPGRKVCSDVFYIGKMRSGDISLGGRVFADNLPQPKEFTLCISAMVCETAMSIDELCALHEMKADDE